jgi:two-component system alkaline phosphatase synthesis response regulator PhoP
MSTEKKSQTAKRILVVDDEPSLTTVFSAKLKRVGFITDVAHDGNEALKKIADDRFDLIILDLMMPKKDGFETLQDLRSKGNNVPVIVASNLSQDEDIKKAKSLGANDYFVKVNTSLEDLVKKVSQQFNK